MVQYIALDLVKRLKSLGFVEVNIVGDHHIYKNMVNGKRVSVPYCKRKDTLPVGTAHQILRIIKECEKEQFYQAVERNDFVPLYLFAL